MLKIKRALISVSDKTGLAELADALHALNVEIISTGGTAKAIKESGVPVKDVSEYTGLPEMMDGRVKTLHPAIHGGLLAVRDNAKHMREAEKHGIGMIDMAVINLYPFEKTVAAPGVSLEHAIENIDIGGPSMIRSAAKNYRSVAVLTSPDQYHEVVKELRETCGVLTEHTRKKLALAAFRLTSAYDKAISGYLGKVFIAGKTAHAGDGLPARLDISVVKCEDLRYGENPHQKGALYMYDGRAPEGFPAAKKLQGKELSFNNILDLNAALLMIKEFDRPSCVIVKHNNPCGAASAKDLCAAYLDALDCDRLSAFGSVVGFSGSVTAGLAELIMKEADFVECVLAPGFEQGAADIFKVKKNIRLVEINDIMTRAPFPYDFKRVDGGMLVQEADSKLTDFKSFQCVTRKAPLKEELLCLEFAWKTVKHVKSNAIVIANGTKTVGIGAGQMSRVDSVKIACEKAGPRAKGACLASDAFFPKPDSIDEAAACGIAAIIQPGGSIKDKDVIEACDRHGIAMLFTGIRHFKH